MADAIVSLIRAASGEAPFAPAEMDELMKYAVRRNLIAADEADRVMADAKATMEGRPLPPKPVKVVVPPPLPPRSVSRPHGVRPLQQKKPVHSPIKAKPKPKPAARKPKPARKPAHKK